MMGGWRIAPSTEGAFGSGAAAILVALVLTTEAGGQSVAVDGIDFNVKTTCTRTAPEGSSDCFDDYAYVGLDGYTCAAWRSDDCDTADDPDTVKLHCPFSCGTCSLSDCKDNEDYRDPTGFSCNSWKGFECGVAATLFGFSNSQEMILLQNCPASCKYCGDQSDAACDFPFFANSMKQSRCVFDEQGGLEWCRGNHISPVTEEPLWKVCVPAGTPCVFPFVYNDTVFDTCAVDQDLAWCPTAVDKHLRVLDGHWAVCDCDVQTDSVYEERATTTSTPTSTSTSTTSTSTSTSTRTTTSTDVSDTCVTRRGIYTSQPKTCIKADRRERKLADLRGRKIEA